MGVAGTFATAPQVVATDKVVHASSGATRVRTSRVVAASPENWNASTRNVDATTLMGNMRGLPVRSLKG